MQIQIKIFNFLPLLKFLWKISSTLILTFKQAMTCEITKHVVALFWKRDFVYCVPNVAHFKKTGRIFSGISALGQSFDLLYQPVHKVWS